MIGVLTLKDGKSYRFNLEGVPARRWKSYAMRHMPYGTAFYGCTWKVEHGEA